MRNPRLTCSALLLSLMLVACGGGGGSDAGDSSPASQSSSQATSSSSSSTTSTPGSSSAASSTSSLSSSNSSSSKSSSAASSSQSSSSPASSSQSSASSGSSQASSAASGLPGGLSSFYVDPASQAWNWVNNNSGDSRAASIRDNIAVHPSGKWIAEWNGDVTNAVQSYTSAAQSAGKLPVLIAYNIPKRDCNSYSGGGASSDDAYKNWIAGFASAIGSRPAIVVLEPDALMQLDCLKTDADRTARLSLLNYALDQFAAKAPNTWVYVDAGHSNWKTAEETATRLINAGISKARGFALNVSNYRATSELVSHGNAITAQLQAKAGFQRTFVIDTSRNGNGPLGSEWCDPAGRKIGVVTQFHTIGSGLELSLWLKIPGEADGCAGGAGQFLPDLAIRLINGN